MLTARGSELDRVLALSWAQMTISRNRLMIVSWWTYSRDPAPFALERTTAKQRHGSPTLEVDALSLNPGRQEATSTGKHWS